MNAARYLLAPLVLLLLLVGCDRLSGPSASDYLERNISVWNSLIAKSNEWSSGPMSERLGDALEKREGLANLKPRLGDEREEVAGMRDAMRALQPPADATELHGKLVASLDEAVVWYDALLTLADLPDDFSVEQAGPLVDAVQASADRFDALTDELDRLQEAYARKHAVILHRDNH